MPGGSSCLQVTPAWQLRSAVFLDRIAVRGARRFPFQRFPCLVGSLDVLVLLSAAHSREVAVADWVVMAATLICLVLTG